MTSKSKRKEQERNWLEVPYDVMANILQRVGAFDILENAQKVCTSWHTICKDTVMLRVIHLDYPYLLRQYRFFKPLREICKHAVDRSQGHLVDITIIGFADNELLEYVANRSSKVRRLEISCCYEDPYESWMEALKKFPLLEELSIYLTDIPKEAIETLGICCPMLKTLKLNDNPLRNREFPRVANERAIAIGENLCELRHLELIGDNMSNIGLEAILDGCRHLESLDLRACFYLDLEEGDPNPIGKIKCLDNNIECVKLPKDFLSGCIYREFLYDYDDCIQTFFGFLDDDDDLPNMEELRKTLASQSMLE